MRKLFILPSVILVVLLVLALAVGCPQESEPISPQEPEASLPPEITYTLDVTVNPSGSGNVSLSPSGGTYDADTEATITATPTQGYIFDHWSGDATGTSNQINLTMDSDKSVTAHFKAYLENGIMFQDNFDDNRNNWAGTVKDGVLYIGESAPEGQTYITWKYKFPPAAPDYPDFGYEVEIIPIEADIGAGRGLAFLCGSATGSDEDLSYIFLITGDGSYKLLTRGEEWRTIIDWTASSYLNTGNASNILKVICQNSIIELYANEHLLESISGEFPDDIGDNGIGLAVVAPGKDTIISFDNIKMWVVTP